MRLYGILAVADGQAQQVIDAVPGLGLDTSPQRAHPHLFYQRNGDTYDLIVVPLAQGVTLAQASNAPGGLWDLFVLVADSRDIPDAHHRWLARTWRYLIRRQQADPGWLLGPWSAAYVAETWPALAAQCLAGGVPLLAGDAQEDAAGWDYRPSQADTDADTDWSPT
jgi:hypothetical protein